MRTRQVVHICPRSGLSDRRPNRLSRCLDLAVERLQRGDIDFGERGERLDRVAQHFERHAGADRESGLPQPLASLRSERIGPSQPLAVAEQRYESDRLVERTRAVFATSETGTVALKVASAAPTEAACGSVKVTRGTAS